MSEIGLSVNSIHAHLSKYKPRITKTENYICCCCFFDYTLGDTPPVEKHSTIALILELSLRAKQAFKVIKYVSCEIAKPTVTTLYHSLDLYSVLIDCLSSCEVNINNRELFHSSLNFFENVDAKSYWSLNFKS